MSEQQYKNFWKPFEQPGKYAKAPAAPAYVDKTHQLTLQTSFAKTMNPKVSNNDDPAKINDKQLNNSAAIIHIE